MVWPLLVACGNALFGRRSTRTLDSENPLIITNSSFDANVIVPNDETDFPVALTTTSDVNTFYEPPSYAQAQILVNTNVTKGAAFDSASPVYLRGAPAESDSECPICLGPATVITARPSCGHWYHPECLFDWLDRSKHRGCPMCDTKIGTDIVVEDHLP